MVLVTVDRRERASAVPALLEDLGVGVATRLLSSGDYVCGPETVVERKTVLDLHLTIAEGRLWPQLKGIREAGRSPCLLIDGEHLYRGAIDADSIRGALSCRCGPASPF